MDIQGAVIVTYLYQLVEGEVRVEKIEWRKDVEAAIPVTAASGVASPGVGAIGTATSAASVAVGSMTSPGPKSTVLPQAIPTSPPPGASPSVWS